MKQVYLKTVFLRLLKHQKILSFGKPFGLYKAEQPALKMKKLLLKESLAAKNLMSLFYLQ